MRNSFLYFVVVFLLAVNFFAVSPPGQMNYQGVLRDDDGVPLDGLYDMVFTFFSDATAGDEILIDSHQAAGSGAVTVSEGLFNVALASGTLTDGSGSGTYTALSNVFADYGEVWIQVNIGGEDLSPRVRVLASAYALNADSLDGLDSTAFLTSESDPSVGSLTSGKWCTSPDGLIVECTSDLPVVSDGDWTISGSDLYSSQAGAVGVGTTTPERKLHVEGNMLVKTYGAVILDQEQALVPAQWSANFAWQSFTAGMDGTLSSISVNLRSPYSDESNCTALVRIYSGEGTVGAILYSQSIMLSGGWSWVPISLSTPLTVTTGNQYTIWIDPAANERSWIHCSAGDPYPGGRLNYDADWDASFRTYIGNGLSPALLVTDQSRIGVGTSTPTKNLHLFSQSNDDGLTFQVADNTYSQGLMFQNSGGFYTWRIYRKDNGASYPDLVFANGASGELSSLDDMVTFQHGGQVGIGNADPSYLLDVAGDIRTEGALRDAAGDSGTAGQILSSTGTGIDWITLLASTITSTDILNWNTAFGWGDHSTAGYLTDHLWTQNGDDIYFDTGYVGIGTDSPLGSLHVVAEEVLDQSQTQGNLVQSPSSLRWQSFTAGLDGDMVRITFLETGINGASRDFDFYEGEGTGGTLLHHDTVQLVSGEDTYIFSTPVAITAGQVYTFALSGPSLIMPMDNTNTYTRGRCDVSSNNDYHFATYLHSSDGGMIVTGGRVGIRTDSPSYTLDVNGDMKTEGIVFRDPENGNTAVELRASDSGYPDTGIALRALTNPNNGDPIFRILSSGGNERLRVDHNGFLSTTNSLQVTGLTENYFAGNVGIGITPSYQLQLSQNSAAKPTSNTWTVASDFRLKKDIRPFMDGMNVVSRINPIWYRYNGLAGMPTDTEGVGIIAQEIAPVAPYTIHSTSMRLREGGEETEEFLGFDSGPLTFVLINALKELDARLMRIEGISEWADQASFPEENDKPHFQKSSENEVEKEFSHDSDSDLQGVKAFEYLPLAYPVEPGSVLALNPANGEELYPCNLEADPMVVGIAGESRQGRVMTIVSGVAFVRTDASMASIRRGDLLVSSPLHGHAMKMKAFIPGTVIGKALEPLDSGTGMIRVLVMMR